MKQLNTSSLLRFVNAYQSTGSFFFEELKTKSSNDIDRVVQILEDTVTSRKPTKLVSDLSSNRIYTSAERATLELANLERAFQLRKKLFEGALTVKEVAKLLGVTRQTPHDRFKKGTLLAEYDNGNLFFPPWQFDSKGPNGVVEGLPELIKALNIPPLHKIAWFIQPNKYLENQSPIDVLRKGSLDRLLKLALAVGVS